MSEQRILKTTAFGGFKKADVLNYIDELNNKAQREKAELDEKILQMQKDLDEMAQKLPDEETAQQEKAVLEEEQKKSREMSSLIDHLNLEMAKQQKILEEKELEIKELKEQSKRAQFQAESYAMKAQKYDEIALKVGELVIDAKQEADRIVERAKGDADAITREKEQRLLQISAEFVQFKSGVENIRKELRDTLELLDHKLGRISEMAEESDFAEETEEAPVQPKAFSSFQYD